jgi:hypothetical protein
MKLLLLLFTSLAVGAEPIVTSIQPDRGPDTGGTRVTITGTDLVGNVVCVLPCPVRVAFGELAVDAVEESQTRVVVITPAHPAGRVDVKVMPPGQEGVTLEDAFTFEAGVESGYEKVLLPVYFEEEIPGAYGSLWRTDFRIRNNGGSDVHLAPFECPPGGACGAVFPLTYSLDPGEALHNPEYLDTRGRSNPSQILYVDVSQAPPRISLSLRVADVSRSTRNAGTDLPVVRESELLTQSSQFFDVPMDAQNFRVLLRVYDLTYTEAEYSIRLYAEDGLAEPVYGATVTAKTSRPAPFRNEAAYAQFDVTDLLKLRRVWPEAVRIEVAPREPGSRYWAFVSITNNDTQLVTLVTPQ